MLEDLRIMSFSREGREDGPAQSILLNSLPGVVVSFRSFCSIFGMHALYGLELRW